MRSRAASLPALCSRSRRSGPPPASASADCRRSSSMRSWCFSFALAAAFFSGKLSSGSGGIIFRKDTNGQMCGKPNCAEKQDNPKKQFRTDRGGSLEGRLARRDVIRGLHENEHRAKSHGNDENGGKD